MKARILCTLLTAFLVCGVSRMPLYGQSAPAPGGTAGTAIPAGNLGAASAGNPGAAAPAIPAYGLSLTIPEPIALPPPEQAAAGTGSQAAASGALPSAAGASSAPKKDFWSALGRAAIISVGVFPIAYLYTNFAFDLGRYIGNNADARYAPWPFRNQNSIGPDTDEITIRLCVAAGLSLCVGAIDAILGIDKK